VETIKHIINVISLFGITFTMNVIPQGCKHSENSFIKTVKYTRKKAIDKILTQYWSILHLYLYQLVDLLHYTWNWRLPGTLLS